QESQVDRKTAREAVPCVCSFNSLGHDHTPFANQDSPLQWVSPVQPGCLGVVALGPWLCVPDFRPVCPGTFATIAKTALTTYWRVEPKSHKQFVTPDPRTG